MQCISPYVRNVQSNVCPFRHTLFSDECNQFFQIEKFCVFFLRFFAFQCMKVPWNVHTFAGYLLYPSFIWKSHLGGMKISNESGLSISTKYWVLKGVSFMTITLSQKWMYTSIYAGVLKCPPTSVWNQHAIMCLHFNTEWVHLKYLVLRAKL